MKSSAHRTTILHHDRLDHLGAAIEHKDLKFGQRIAGFTQQQPLDHNTPRNEFVAGLAKIESKGVLKPLPALCPHISPIERRVDADLDAVARCMRALDDVGRRQLIKRNAVGILTDPEQGNQDAGSSSRGNEIAYRDLVGEDRMHRVEIEQFAPLDFFREGPWPQQPRIPAMGPVVTVPHHPDRGRPMPQALNHGPSRQRGRKQYSVDHATDRRQA
jgi:hypothetical protein